MKTNYFNNFILVTYLFVLVSCHKTNKCDTTGPVIIYKTRNDYSNNISVQLSDDKNRVTAFPGAGDAVHQRPDKLVNGYYRKKMAGNAFLSITFDEYISNPDKYPSTALINYVIDTDPFIEEYECCECLKQFDTVSINSWIKAGNLNLCERLK